MLILIKEKGSNMLFSFEKAHICYLLKGWLVYVCHFSLTETHPILQNYFVHMTDDA